MSKALKARLARLEQRKFGRRLPRIIYSIHGRDEVELIGYRIGNVTVMRAPGEPLGELQARAWGLGAGHALEALYRPENRPSAVLAEPWTPPPTPAEPEPDPYAVGQPGIGAIASREMLERMGAIPVPPERLI